MGLAISEMLRADYFKDFKVIAGHGGIDKQIQGIAILDSPDGYKWTKGRELVVSSGYIFKAHPDLFEKYMNDSKFIEISGMAIKVDRYLGEIDRNILDKFDEYNIPLINVPNEPSWMDIMNHLNVLVMNRKIKQFKIESVKGENISDLSYQNRKINKILYQIEKEMNFPAMLYDVQNDRAYYSSNKFKTISAKLDLSDFWEPSFKHTTEILCDNLAITRFRFIDKKYKAPYSWIEIPIKVDNKIKAYFVVLEAEGLIDYFDQFALRIGFLLIQSMYEQILVSQSLRDAGFKKLIRDLINEKISGRDNILEISREIDLDIEKEYIIVLAEDSENQSPKERETFERNFQTNFGRLGARIAIASENTYLFLIPIAEEKSLEENISHIKKLLVKLNNSMKRDLPSMDLKYGISDIQTPLADTYKSYRRGLKALEIGRLLYKEFDYISYSQLGPLAWMDIRADEIEIMKGGIGKLIENDEDKILIETLDTYLGSNMNYSLTAKKMYIHINTVRKRMEEINDLIDIDLEDPISRLKLEILLKIINKSGVIDN